MVANIKVTRARLLAGVGTAVIASFASAGVHAQLPASTQINGVQTSATAIGHDTNLASQDNVGAITPSVTGATAGITQIESSQSDVSNSVTENVILSEGIGNVLEQSIDIFVINDGEQDDPDAEPASGAASFGIQTNIGAILSTASENRFGIDLGDFDSGGVENIDNAIGARATGNQATNIISGAVPSGYESSASGASAFDYELAPVSANLLAATGTLVASTAQAIPGTAVNAHALSNDISLTLEAPGLNNVVAAPLLDDNVMLTDAAGNSAETEIAIEGGSDPAFAGSAVVSNLQSIMGSGVTASTSSNTIVATIDASDDGVNTLNGNLSVKGNAISSAAIGNEAAGATPNLAGNRISLDHAMSFAGSGTASPGSTVQYDNGDLHQTVAADLVISSSQSNLASGIGALTNSNQILAQVQSVDGGQITVGGNSLTGDAKGNSASNSLASGEGANSFQGSVAVANQQTNFGGVGQNSVTIGNTIAAVTGGGGGVTHAAAITVGDNRIVSTTIGNSVSQNLSLDANTIDIGGGNAALTGGIAPDGNVSAQGGATITNLQSSYVNEILARNTQSVIGLDADSRGTTAPDTQIVGSTLSTTGNRLEARAAANAAGNQLSLAGNDVSTGAGIASVQISDDDSSVESWLGDTQIGLIASTHVVDSTLEVSGNRQRSVASGSTATNDFTVLASGTTTVGDATGPASTITLLASAFSLPLPFDSQAGALPTVSASFGILNDQAMETSVNASALNVGTGLNVEGNVIDSIAKTEGNAVVAAAYGNDAKSSASLEFGNVDAVGGNNLVPTVAAIANTQAMNSSIEAVANGANVVTTAIEDDVSGSTVSTSNNVIEASAYGNNANANSLAVAANNIHTDVGAPVVGMNAASFSNTTLLLQANASFSVQNAQSAHGFVSASQLDNNIIPTMAASVLTSVGGTVSDTIINSDGNKSTAGAIANIALNSLALTANDLSSTTGIQNFQESRAVLVANIGISGTPGADATSPTAFTVGITTGSPLSYSTSTGSSNSRVTGGTVQMQKAGLTPEQVLYLVNVEGWSDLGGTLSLPATTYFGTVPIPTAQITAFRANGGQITTIVPGTSAVAAIPNQGGVVVVAPGDSITGSTVSVADNVTAGSVIGNSASNAIAVNANAIKAGSDPSASTAGYNSSGIGAVADHALSNLQASESPATSLVFGTFAIDTVEGASIDRSTLSVVDNEQSSTAAANTAWNILMLDGKSVSAGSALSSIQGGQSPITAFSDVDLLVPAAVTGSTVEISGNSNSSLAVMNDAVNQLRVTASDIDPVNGATFAELSNISVIGSAVGDHVLSNLQVTTDIVSSTASSTLYNEDRVEETGSGLVDSSLAMSGNSTSAEASANRADSMLTLNGSAVEGANAGLANMQSSTAAVTSSATTSVSVQLTGAVARAALNASTIAVSGNGTSALARGNAATNQLTLNAGSSYGDARTGTAEANSDSSGTIGVSAQAAILNGQGNYGAVTANSDSTLYGVALNSVSGDTGVANSIVAVFGNRVSAQAYGNSATNKLMVTALNTGAPTAALGNYQMNFGAITANATNVTFGITAIGGSTNGSNFGVKGNQITASAIGNSASNLIGR